MFVREQVNLAITPGDYAWRLRLSIERVSHDLDLEELASAVLGIE